MFSVYMADKQLRPWMVMPLITLEQLLDHTAVPQTMRHVIMFPVIHGWTSLSDVHV